MAGITQTTVTSFKVEMFNGIHAFGTTVVRATTTPDTFKIALYTSTATLDASTTVYTTTGEVVGTGYTAGGQTLTVSPAPASGGTTPAYLGFNNVTWPSATFTAAGALIYNSTQNNKAVAVLSFGSDKTVTAKPFTVVFPSATSTTAIVRIS
jgi:acyl CoA:acetate/3-ketoacid CoA transferase beta subunit